MSERLLPLFPLNVVLFPQADLPLHIFEERYKEMVNDCLRHGWEFGVLLAKEQSVENTGCTASITEVLKTYDDGRMDIRTRGRRRFSVLLLNSDKPYLRGEPQFFEDEEDAAPPDDARRERVLELYQRANEILHPGQGGRDDRDLQGDAAQLSYGVLSRLPVDLDFKQSLLQLTSENERLIQVAQYLEQWVPRLAVVAKARAGARHNGKGH